MANMRTVLAWAFSVALTLALLEAGLRVFPEAVPLALLKRFERELRLEIAERRQLPNETQTYALERDDGGPPIRVFKPFSSVRYGLEDTGERGETVMDGLGFCNAARDDHRLASIQFIAIGDSFTVCHAPAPELAWPSVVGQLARRTSYNLGRGGYGPYEYVQLLRAFGLGKRPDVVVMQIYEGNDLRDAVWFQRYVDATPEERKRFSERASVEAYSVEPSAFLGNPLARHSYAYNLAVVGTARGLSELWDLMASEPRAHVNFRYRLKFPGGSVAMNVRNTDKDEVLTALDLEAGAIRFDAMDGALERFAALSREHGFRAVVSYAPSAHTAYAEFVEFEDPRLKPLLAEFSRAQRSHLQHLASTLGLHFLDLTPALRDAARKEQGARLLYFPINVHFTPAGHEVVAKAVVETLGPSQRGQSHVE